MNARRVGAIAAMSLLVFGSGVATGQPLGTAFTYQGRLAFGGAPASGLYDVQFTLYDAAQGGGVAGGPVCADQVVVADGLFTAPVDFGNAFDGGQRWLEVGVRADAIVGNCAAGSYTPLGPRQPVTATPYALKTRGVDGHSLDAVDGSPGDALFVGPTGNVGIGTVSPGAMLDVYTATGTVERLRLSGTGFANAASSTAGVSLLLGPNVDSGNRQFWIGVSDALAINSTNGVIRINPGGTAGTGTIDAISTNATRKTLQLGGLDLAFLTGGVERMRVASSGYVGVNTSSPTRPVSIRAGAGDDYFSLRSMGDTERWAVKLGAGAALAFVQGDGTERVRFGFATGDPAVETSGTVKTGVLEITGGSDIAEPFNVHPSRAREVGGPGDQGAEGVPDMEAIEDGMVVSIDPRRVGELRVSNAAYDRTVAGVISGAGGVQPGMTLRQSDSVADGRHPVALTGRVWCRADADAGGPIRPGDLLTTSDRPGHAMKVTDFSKAPGATLGKAMSSLETGRGLVLVLVNLQ